MPDWQPLVDRARASDTTSFAVLQRGHLVAGTDADVPLHTGSVTKLVVGLCVATALYQRSLMSLEVPACTVLEEWRGTDKERITLRHLLAHCSGLAADWPEFLRDDPDDWTSAALGLPLVARPGEVVVYNNLGAQLVCEIVRRVTGLPIDEYAGASLFDPLGIEDWMWNHDRCGSPFGMSALQLTAGDLAKLGQLLLDLGVTNGSRLFAADWFSTASALAHPDAARFGLFMFREPSSAPRAFGHDGSGGQHLWVIPEHEVVVARLRVMDERWDQEALTFRDLPRFVLKVLDVRD